MIEVDLEAFCHRCGGPNIVWHAPSPLWNAVMRQGEVGHPGDEPWGGIICPRCFAEVAEAAGVAGLRGGWCLRSHDVAVDLPTTFGDGRVWDAERCLWVEPVVT